MNPAQLLAHFDRLCEAPDAVPRLRRFILDLAVRGKLVEQDPNDEPAADLLKRIRAEKDRLLKAGKIRPQPALPRIARKEEPFEVPTKWQWVRFGDLINDSDAGWSPRTESFPKAGDNWGVVKVSAVTWGKFLAEENKQLLPGAIPPTGTQIRRGDFLISRANTSELVAKCVIVENEPTKLTLSDKTVRLDIAFECNKKFLCIVNNHAAHARSYYAEEASGTSLSMKNVSRPVIYALAIPFPPLAEQHRIVVKVDELMALCDRLEAAQAERESRRDRLAAASLQRLNQPADPDSFREHARFHLQHLARLTTRPEQIKQLRQAILNLAVRGKLVPQDPNDEPVAKLIERMKAEKLRLTNVGRLRSETPVKPLEADGPISIPSSWAWVPFGDIMISRDGERIPVSKDERNTRAKTFNYYGASGVIDKIDSYLFDKPLLLVGEDGANLINRSTPIAFIARGKYWVNNHAHVLDGISEDFLRYVELNINAIDLKPYVTGTAQPKMNQAKMNSIPIALPPEAEQQRIVAKVEELLALCDRLEAHLNTAQTESRRLLEAVLQDALAIA